MADFSSERVFIIIGAALLLIGVAAGAFGAHALRAWLSPERLAVWHTAVLYQLVHGLGILILMALRAVMANRWLRRACQCMVAGTVLFSGSLYALVLFDWPSIARITPVGGILFIVAWAMVAVAALSQKNAQRKV